MTGRHLYLPDELAAQILTAAARSYPEEACGLVEGEDTPEGWRVLAIHQAANLAEEPSRHFLIDPAVQFSLLRGLRGTGRRILGCFHSHPGGAPQPSATDRAAAMEVDFLWLIAGGEPGSGLTLCAYLFSEGGGFVQVEISGIG